MRFWHRAAIFIPIVLIVCLMPALLMGFLGYEPSVEWNNAAIQGTCTIKENKIEHHRCSYDCNCYYYTDSNGNRRERCSTCWRDCYYLDILLEHTHDESPHSKWFTVIWRSTNAYFVQSQSTTAYAVGKTMTCYFHEENLDDIELSLKDAPGMLGGTIFFAALGFCVLVAWGILEIFIYLGYCC